MKFKMTSYFSNNGKCCQFKALIRCLCFIVNKISILSFVHLGCKILKAASLQ